MIHGFLTIRTFLLITPIFVPPYLYKDKDGSLLHTVLVIFIYTTFSVNCNLFGHGIEIHCDLLKT